MAGYGQINLQNHGLVMGVAKYFHKMPVQKRLLIDQTKAYLS